MAGSKPSPIREAESHPRPSSIRRLVEAELGRWEHGRSEEDAPWLKHPREDFFGLALSGGGIRSATFNLGLLQSLNKLGLLKHFHYLSTVSGGGYVGGWWTRWRDWQDRLPDGDRPNPLPVLPRNRDGSLPAGLRDPDDPVGAEDPAVRHLREYSNFLAPRLGVFSWDTGRIVVSACAAMLPSLFVAGAVLLLGIYLLLVIIWGLTGNLVLSPPVAIIVPVLAAVAGALAFRLRAGRTRAVERVALWVGGAVLLLVTVPTAAWVMAGAPAIPRLGLGASPALFSAGPIPAWLAMLVVTGVALLWFEWLWRRRREPGSAWSYFGASVLALAITGVAWTLVSISPPVWGHGWAPPGAAALASVSQDGPAATAGLLAPGAGASAEADSEARLGATAATTVRDLAYLYRLALPWLLVILVFVILRTVSSQFMINQRRRQIRAAFDRVQARISFLVAAWTVGVSMWIAGAILASISSASGGVAYGGLTGLLALLFAFVQRKLSHAPVAQAAKTLRVLLRPVLPQVLAYSVVTLWTVGLIALVLRVDWLRAEALTMVFPGALAVVGSALLLFNPNEVGLHGFYRARLVRAFAGACNTLFSRRTEECPADDLQMDEIRVGGGNPRVHLVCCAANHLDSETAMQNLNRGAVSAALSHVGFSVGNRHARWGDYDGTIPTLGAAMTASGAAFNTLLGWRSVLFGPGVTFLLAALNLRLGLWLRHPDPPQAGRASYPWHRLPGFPYLKEMFSSVSSNDALVHLSDGGHFENLGAYELIRRHCRVVVVSDCGQDGATEFEDLGRLCRLVRTDFQVDIRIDISPLRPGPDGRARQHMVAGDIHYPDGDTGVLLYFKPVLVGSEPADVFHYRTQNTDFPHETTLDQFYDEAQWEAYRRLGEHATTTAFRSVLSGGDVKDGRAVAEIFGRARREWKGARDGLHAGLGRFRTGSAELEDALRKPENSLLLHQVYPELAGGKLQMPRLFEESSRPEPPLDSTVAPAAEVAESELFTLRRMLLLLHELYESEALEANHGDPAYLGMINYFRRWTTTERMAFWFPVLKPHFPPVLVRFIEQRLGGRAYAEPRVRIAVGPRAAGLDLLREPERTLRRSEVLLSYWVRLGGEGAGARDVRMARVIARRDRHAERLVWPASEFVVADGFWGVGIGQSFLRELGRGIPGHSKVKELLVRLQRPQSASAAEKQALATDMQLYRSAGFREEDEPRVDRRIELWMNARVFRLQNARSRAPEPGIAPVVQWMRLEVNERIPEEGDGLPESRLAAPPSAHSTRRSSKD